MNEHPTIDLHCLHLLRLVAKHQGITAASGEAGLSQSALTRQIQLIEARLGLQLFERSTRRLRITPAGSFLLRETAMVSGLLDSAMRRLKEEFSGEQREIRIGVSRSVSLAHLPGLFHGQRRHHPEVKILVSHLGGSALLEALAACRLDLAVLCPPPRLPEGLELSHRIQDSFVVIAGQSGDAPDEQGWSDWVKTQNWIVPPTGTRSRDCIDRWWKERKLQPNVAMEIDSFDVTIQLVALGMGAACVPRRALSTFPRKRQIRRIKLPEPMTRELAIVTPKRGSLPEHVRDFIAEILFR
ncbi:LysR family transcriptional regulator [Luteolibacter sp. GHJ8]|uniref:LysR family transcriptional regulator n=1 Tax=Luteolibacter rhizosphaerae TaxID=2989719 RepID=A0ABT3G0I1_9BACT|nr:LysR family transcriptional regulator [Luteolibacter rhizosphaerae]MCW1913346.1 LysR family transcriptional regulator [Luteolibacter rhizosphaerae]